ncbi:MAG: tRNA lysidine(34) synthetase TilS [Chitinophagales bacterium]|nr:tRNA lysidine(34) synthetase TilS [Chitinophagales bacterium]
MLPEVLSFIAKHKLFAPKEPVLLAVSGGVDSTVLAYLFKAAGFRFALAHINFRLRAEDSEADEHFVKNLAQEMSVPFFSTAFDTQQIASERKISIQMAARELRYEWLEQVRRENGYHFIATAHHCDDQVETVMLNMFRGTGIHGLQGIKAKHGKVIRPMLTCSKNEILSFARSERIAFREDASNKKTDYDRNKIRLEIIPAIEQFYPAFKSVFQENISRWNDAGHLYDAQVGLQKKKLIAYGKNEVVISIPRLRLQSAAAAILYEILKEYGFSPEQSAFVHAAFDAQPGKVFYSSTHRILKDRNQLIITARQEESSTAIYISGQTRSIRTDAFELLISVHQAEGFKLPKDQLIACLNYEMLQFPLLMRKWKTGDYFYPLGMKSKKKKISDYLIDKKMPLHKKEHVWVIQSGDRIACIIGERIDERFKVTAATGKILVLTPSMKIN